MGLNRTHVILAIEDKFKISIFDDVEREWNTVGDVIRYVVARTAGHSESTCRTASSFYRLRRTLLARTSVARKHIRPDRHFDDIIPIELRRRTAQDLRAEGFDSIQLVTSVTLRLATLALIGLLVAGVWWCTGSWLSIILAPLFLYLFDKLSTPWTVHIVGDATIRGIVVAHSIRQAKANEDQKPGPNEISHHVKYVIAKLTGKSPNDLQDDTKLDAILEKT